jgi:hypothetical protein
LGSTRSRSTTTATKPTSSGRRGRKAQGDLGTVIPSEILAPNQRRSGGRSAGGSLAAIAIGLIIAVIAAVALAGVVFTVLRILELVLVAAAAGWVGYHIGHFRGSRRR